MAFGGGKYGPEADALMRDTDAGAVVVIIVGGKKGSGFSVSMMGDPVVIDATVMALRSAADQLARDAIQLRAQTKRTGLN